MGSLATWNGAKDACPRSHPYDAENTYVNPAGKRECRRCHARRQREYGARNSSTRSRVERIDSGEETPPRPLRTGSRQSMSEKYAFG